MRGRLMLVWMQWLESFENLRAECIVMPLILTANLGLYRDYSVPLIGVVLLDMPSDFNVGLLY